MKRRSRLVMTLSSLAVLAMGCATVVSVSSCGNNSSASDVLKGEFGGVKADYFDCYFTREIDGADSMVSTSGSALIESGTAGVKIHSYDVPEGYTVSYVVLDSDGKDSSDVKIAEDGSVTLPEITGSGASARKDYTITIVAKDPSSETKIKKSTSLTVVPKGSITTGVQDLTGLTTDDSQSIFGQVEQLGMETGMAGMNFWAYGGYQKISNRVYNTRSENGKFTGSTYVPGYGFGYDSYCYLSEDNPKESNSNWKRYYHAENSNQPTTSINYFNSSGSDVSDYWQYCTAPYFGKLLNESDSDQYVPSMSSLAEPIACDDNGNELSGKDADGFHTKWKIKFNTGTTTDKVAYRCLGTKNGSTYDGKGVELKDYLTPYILQYTQWVGCKNVTQLLNGASALKGGSEYYAATKTKPESGKVDIDEFLANFPAIKVNEADNSMTFEFAKGCTSDYAGYRLNNQGVMPLDFVQETLGKGDLAKGMLKIATKDDSDGSNPEDNMLSTGNYVLEKMTEDKLVFKKNDAWYVKKDPAGRVVYQMAGRVFTLNSALQQDTTNTLSYANYQAGYTESATIPSAILADEKNKADTVHIENTGDKNGVSFNGLNYLDYQALFGENGTACAGQFYGDSSLGSASNKEYRSTYFADDWKVKPAMGNHNFLKGLNTGYDRNSFAATKGRVGFSDYFGDINKMSPKATTRWNGTQEHKDAVKAVYGDNGINLSSNEQGVSYFKLAIQEELDAGHYVLGTGSTPASIDINVNWQGQMWVDYQGTAIFNAIEDTFLSAVKSNTNWVDANGNPLIVLNIEQTYEGNGSTDYMNAYAKVALGQYDIAQVSISGGEYEVFQELSLWESINRNYSLTIHHAFLTYVPSSSIYYNGSYWSPDGLLYANQEGVTLDQYGRIDYTKLNAVE